ncbi:hypothetical protein [Nostoc sp.]|uniref:hypothetical protein n=1 Tax=Nostoc sp. TaxID=1180 RepID=UPI002FF7B74B
MKFLTALPVTDSTTVSYPFEGHWGLGGDEEQAKHYFSSFSMLPQFWIALASQTLRTVANATLTIVFWILDCSIQNLKFFCPMPN